MFVTNAAKSRNLYNVDQALRLKDGKQVAEKPALENIEVPKGVILEPLVSEGGIQVLTVASFALNNWLAEAFFKRYNGFGVIVSDSTAESWLVEISEE